MEKVSVEMELDEWEFLSDLDYEHGGKGKLSKDPKGVIRPFPGSRLSDIPLSANSGPMSPVPIDLEAIGKKKKKDQELELELSKVAVPFIDIGVIMPPVNKDTSIGSAAAAAADQDTISRVFFKKMKDNEFVDMKMDSPKSSSKGLKLLVEAKEEDRTSAEVQECLDSDTKKETNWDGNLNIWGRRVTGVGALCCIGVAAATTICIFILGSRGRGNKQHRNQKIQFQIHSDDHKVQKMKQVVNQDHVLAQAIAAAATGVSLSEAHVYFGGY